MISSALFETVVKVTVLILSLIARILKLANRTEFIFDEGRDLLIARHIARYGETAFTGHYASGFRNGFFHPPYYYYLLSFLTRIYDQPVFIYAAVSAFNLLSLYLLYKAAVNLFNRRVGLTTLVFYAVLGGVIEASAVWPSYLALSFFILSFYLLSLAVKTGRTRHILASVSVFVLTVFINYKFLAFLPAYFTVSVFLAFRGNRAYYKSAWRAMLTAAYWLGLLVAGIYPLVRFFGIGRLISVFSGSVGSPHVFPGGEMIRLTGSLFGRLFSFNDTAFAILTAVTAAILAVSLRTSLVGKKKDWAHLMLFAAVLSGLAVTAQSSIEVASYKLLIFFPLVSVLLASGIDTVFGNRFGYLRSLIIALFIFGMVNPSYLAGLNAGGSPRSIQTQESVSAAILDRMGRADIGGDFQIFSKDSEAEAYLTAVELYYFLERKTGRKYTRIPAGTNATGFLVETEPAFVFLACRGYDDASVDGDCLGNFITERGKTYGLFERIPTRTPVRVYLLKKT